LAQTSVSATKQPPRLVCRGGSRLTVRRRLRAVGRLRLGGAVDASLLTGHRSVG